MQGGDFLRLRHWQIRPIDPRNAIPFRHEMGSK